MLAPEQIIELSEAEFPETDRLEQEVIYINKAFEWYGNAENLKNKMKQIIKETQAGLADMEVVGEEISMDEDPESHMFRGHKFPTEDVNNYMNKQLFPCPVIEDEKSDHSWKENNTHLSPEQMQKVEELLKNHQIGRAHV